MRGFYPHAVNRNIPPGSSDPAITPRVAILHVDAGNASSLFDFFKNRSGGIESHFHIRRDGVVEQYRSIYFQADANRDANDFAVSIETQGFGEGEWTGEQVAAIKALLLWLNAEASIPLRKIRFWDGSGVGYHTLFGAPSRWTPVAKSCPGPDRKVQFHDVLVPWFKTALEPAPEPIRVVTFNVWVGQKRERLRANLLKLVKRTKRPHVIVLQEANRFRGTLRGYQRVEVPESHTTAAGQTVMLVRNDGVIHQSGVVRGGSLRWRGPKHGKMHDPREHPWAAVEFDGEFWDVLGVHRVWTGRGKRNMDAWAAEDRAIAAWAKKRAEDRPNRGRLIVGDQNARAADGFPANLRDLAKRTRGRVRLRGIDGAIAIGCTATTRKLFRKFGSDGHRPVVIVATKENQ